MESVLYTFPAQPTEDQMTFWLGLIGALATLGVTVWLLRRPSEPGGRNRQMLLAMLTFFLFLIALGVTIFSAWSMYRLGDVTITAQELTIGREAIGLKDIANARIETVDERSLINPSIVKEQSRLLVIYTRAGQTFVLPEASYDVEGILEGLREVVGINE